MPRLGNVRCTSTVPPLKASVDNFRADPGHSGCHESTLPKRGTKRTRFAHHSRWAVNVAFSYGLQHPSRVVMQPVASGCYPLAYPRVYYCFVGMQVLT